MCLHKIISVTFSYEGLNLLFNFIKMLFSIVSHSKKLYRLFATFCSQQISVSYSRIIFLYRI